MQLPAPWGHAWAGHLEQHLVDSQALMGNPLGDPHLRPLLVYTPPGYAADTRRRYPSVYVLQGLSGQVDMWNSRKSFQPTAPEAIDDAMREAAEPAVVVFVDAWTRLGGSQFLDSPGTGRYHTYLCDEVVPFVDGRYRTLPGAEHRGVAGHSSGGYGAMVSVMLRPDLFGGLATHAGDALFEVCYGPDLRAAARALRDDYDGSYDAFWSDFRGRPGRSRRSDDVLLNVYCMAACYSADAGGGVQLPFELGTGRLLEDVWERWLGWDPVRMAPRAGDALRGLRAAWIDGGRDDEYYLDLGAEAFRRALERLGVGPPVVHFELFDGKHGGVAWRYPPAIAWLAARLAP